VTLVLHLCSFNCNRRTKNHYMMIWWWCCVQSVASK